MFPWRSLITIFAFAFLFAFVTSEFRREQQSHLSRRTQRAAEQREIKRELTKSFAARSPARKIGLESARVLTKRDVCTDAFNGERVTQTCSPSQTLCCIIPQGDLPQCTTILGYGFCCTEHTDCFVDLDTACGTTGASTCADGLCCPSQTTCISDFEYSNSSLVRCYVNRDLIPSQIAALGSSSSSASSTATTSGAASSSTTATFTVPIVSESQSVTVSSASTSPTSNPDGNDSSSLGGGPIAGIVIGAVAGIAIIAGLAWFFLRKKKPTSDTSAAAAAPLAYNPVPQEPPGGVQEMGSQQLYEAPGNQEYYGQQQPTVKYANQADPASRHELA